MVMHFRIICTLLSLILHRAACCLLLILSSSVAEGANRYEVSFAGNWELDYQMSDHPSEKIRHVYTETRAALERELQRQSRYVDPQMLNLSSIVGLGRLAERIAQATVLNISQAADHIIVKRNDDFALTCDFDQMNEQQSVIGSEACHWEEDQLVFRIALPDGLRVQHRLSIARDRSRLNVATTVQLAGVRYPFTLNMVYMPYEEGESQYRCEFTIAKQTTCTLGTYGEPKTSGEKE